MRNPDRAKIGSARGYIGNSGHAVQENLNVCAEDSDQQRAGVKAESFENDLNSGLVN